MDIRKVEEVKSFSDEKAAKNPVAFGDHCRVTLWCLKVGQEIHPHIHAGDHVWVVEEGEGVYLDGEKEHAVAKGDVIFAPEGEPHGMRATTPMTFVSVSAGS